MRQVMRVLLSGFEPLNNPSKRDDVNASEHLVRSMRSVTDQADRHDERRVPHPR
jgi:hypothetical protein